MPHGTWLAHDFVLASRTVAAARRGCELFDTTSSHEGEKSTVQRSVVCGTAGL